MTAVLILSGNLRPKTVIDAIWVNNSLHGPIETFHLVHSYQSHARQDCRASAIQDQLRSNGLVNYPIKGIDHRPEDKEELDSDYAGRVVREVVKNQVYPKVEVIVDLSGARRPQAHALYAAANVCAISKIHMVDLIDRVQCKDRFLKELELDRDYRLVVFHRPIEYRNWPASAVWSTGTIAPNCASWARAWEIDPDRLSMMNSART